MHRARPNEPVREVAARWLREVVWPQRGLAGRAASLLLRPASLLYGLGVALRNLAYDWGVFPVARASIPVISIGNLAAGGTGKTPVALWLARKLQERGRNVAIVLRGYGGLVQGAVLVGRGRGLEVDVRHAGDEATLLAKKFAGGVIVSPDRARGVELARNAGYDVAVLDDGFQHRALARDFDFVLLSGRLGPLLPAGPLREPFRALKRADAVAVVDRGFGWHPLGPPRSAAAKPLFYVRLEATTLVESHGGRWDTRPLGDLSGRTVAAVTGIADPVPFYAMLRQWEVHVREVFEFADHHAYNPSDWQLLSRSAQRFDCLVTTEKDLVKLEHFPFARGKLVALRVEPVVDREEELLAAIEDRLGRDGTHHRASERTVGGLDYAAQ